MLHSFTPRRSVLQSQIAS